MPALMMRKVTCVDCGYTWRAMRGDVLMSPERCFDCATRRLFKAVFG